MTDCVLFDLDGTLVDSERISARAFQIMLPGRAPEIEDFVHRYAGARLADVVADLAGLSEAQAEDAFIPRFRQIAADLLRQDLRPFDGVAEALARLPMPICVASNAPRDKIALALEVTGLASFFGGRLFSAYNIGRWKPDPALFLTAAAEMGFAPERCTVIEDSAPGMAAGLAAGMRVLRFHNDPAYPAGPEGFGRYRDLPGLLGVPPLA